MALQPSDNLLVITREFLNPDVVSFGVLLRRRLHEFGNINTMKPKEPATTGKSLNATSPGFSIEPRFYILT